MTKMEYGGGGKSMIDYSKEIEIGTWIDGKTVYQKTLTFTTKPVLMSGTEYKFSDLALDFDKLINMYGMYYRTDGEQQPLPYGASVNTAFVVGVESLTPTQMLMTIGATAYSRFSSISLVIQYTK